MATKALNAMMASTDPERSNGPRGKTQRQRPPIWTGGRQRPPFDLAAFWRVTKANSRDLLWPVLARIGERFERGAHALACGFGASMVTRLKEAARVLPPRRTVVTALRGTGLWLLVGADRIDRIGRPPAETEVEHDELGLGDDGGAEKPAKLLGPELASTTRVTALRPVRPEQPQRASDPEPEPVPAPEADFAPAPEPAAMPHCVALGAEPLGPEDDPLLAIRTMMRAAAAPAPVPRKPPLAPPPEPDPITGLAALPPLAPPEPPAPGPALRAFGIGTGLAIFALSLPLGGLLAGISYLRGEDLRLRETA